jgi:hypothetical protein
VLQRMPPYVPSKHFQKCELLAGDPETTFVTQYFLHCKPHRFAIGKIYCIHNPAHTQNFEGDAQKFLPGWSSEQESARKQAVIQRWKGETGSFQPLQVSIGGQKWLV